LGKGKKKEGGLRGLKEAFIGGEKTRNDLPSGGAETATARRSVRCANSIHRKGRQRSEILDILAKASRNSHCGL